MQAFFLFLILSFMMKGQNQQQVSSGRLVHLDNFPSQYVQARNVDIWLPEEYDGKKKFAVLYMNDGQMLFDSNATWNGQSWEVDDIAARLMHKHKVENFIVVGIWNTLNRHADYFPQKPFENLAVAEKDTVTAQLQRAGRTTEAFQPVSDNYLKFLVSELKPMIDANYAVYTDLPHTFIAGSSMGGLISCYAICEYPAVFGGAACLSTHWLGTFTDINNPCPEAFIHYLENSLPNPENHKFYFDCGDQTLDAFYPPIQQKVDSVMRSKGYSGENWETYFFKGKDHSENAWNECFEIPLLFLFGEGKLKYE